MKANRELNLPVGAIGMLHDIQKGAGQVKSIARGADGPFPVTFDFLTPAGIACLHGN